MKDLESKAIERIKAASEMSLHHYGKPLVCTYSGGKDSDVLLELFRRSGIPFEVHHSHTTADAPETVYHIRKVFRDLELQGIKCYLEMPMFKGERTSMWALIPERKIPPTRNRRYCCSILKETGCKNRFIATGVRWDESVARSERESYEIINRKKEYRINVSDEIMLMNDNSEKRKMIEKCEMKAKACVNPIIDWEHGDIWRYIHANKIEMNPLYENGYHRVGCIGCPMAGKKRYKEFADYPTFKTAYIHAFQRMVERRLVSTGSENEWKCGESVFRWWMEDKNIEGQMKLDLG